MKLFTKEELKSSRIFFDKQPPEYLLFINFFLTVFFISLIIASSFVTKNYIVKAHGTIEADDKLYVTPTSNGNVIEIHKQSGEQVKKGDVLLTLSIGTEGIQEEELKKQIEEMKNKTELYDKYERSLKNKANHLKNKGEEQSYYGKVAYYLEQIQGETIESTQMKEKIGAKEKEINMLKEDKNLIKERRKKNYQVDLERKQSQIEKLQKEIEILRNTNKENEFWETEIEVKKSEIASLQVEIEELNDTNDEQLKTELDAKENEIKALEGEIKEINNGLNSSPASNSTYHQLISELGTERVQTNEKISELETQLNIKNADSNTLHIIANKDGNLHYLIPMKLGLGLQAFQPVAHIDNNEGSNLIVESYISAQDVSKVMVNNSVKVAIDGVNQTKFGTLDGKVIKISNGTITQHTENNNQKMLYQVYILLITTELKNDSDKIRANPSMPVTANIVYEKETYLEWLLEQLNFLK